MRWEVKRVGRLATPSGNCAGIMDRLVGGVGMRRGRRHPRELRVGDPLDFWRVEALESPHLLRLRAEMKLPGRAWLQFEVLPDPGGCRVEQTAFFEPRGILGYLYWYLVLPTHRFVFPGLIGALKQRAEAGDLEDVTTVIAVIGAGAAGFIAACHAAGAGRRVVLLERTAEGGRKILVSGGGRCNVLPGVLGESRFVTASSANSLRKILRSWPLAEQRRFLEETLGIPLELGIESGKLFPESNRARDVRDGLVRLARDRGVEFLPNTSVIDLAPEAGCWKIGREGADPLTVDRVIVATGGLSVPKTGSDGTGLAILDRLGLEIHPTFPALTPLTVNPNPFGDLAGISLRVTLRATSIEERCEATGGFLFTHRGYSGPAVLDISHVAVRSRLAGGPPAELRIQWCDLDEAAWQARLAPGTQGSRDCCSGRAAGAAGRPIARVSRRLSPSPHSPS